MRIEPVLRFLLYMAEIDLNLVLVFEVAREGVGSIDAAVLPAGAAEVHGQVGEAAPDVFFNADVHNIENAAGKDLIFKISSSSELLPNIGVHFFLSAKFVKDGSFIKGCLKLLKVA